MLSSLNTGVRMAIATSIVASVLILPPVTHAAWRPAVPVSGLKGMRQYGSYELLVGAGATTAFVGELQQTSNRYRTSSMADNASRWSAASTGASVAAAEVAPDGSRIYAQFNPNTFELTVTRHGMIAFDINDTPSTTATLHLDPSAPRPTQLDVATNANEHIVVVWTSHTSTTSGTGEAPQPRPVANALSTAVLASGASGFTTPQILGTGIDPRVVIDPSGSALIAWSDTRSVRQAATSDVLGAAFTTRPSIGRGFIVAEDHAPNGRTALVLATKDRYQKFTGFRISSRAKGGALRPSIPAITPVPGHSRWSAVERDSLAIADTGRFVFAVNSQSADQPAQFVTVGAVTSTGAARLSTKKVAAVGFDGHAGAGPRGELLVAYVSGRVGFLTTERHSSAAYAGAASSSLRSIGRLPGFVIAAAIRSDGSPYALTVPTNVYRTQQIYGTSYRR